jgi:hypothetical protein
MPPPPTVEKPKTNLPPPKDVPWWGALILAILTSIVSVIATIFYMRGNVPPIPGAPPGIGMIFTDAITFLPHILIVFGIFADIFTLQGAYSIPSLIGLLSIPTHFMMQFLWTGASGFLGDLYKLVNTAPAATPPPAPPVQTVSTGTNTATSGGSRSFDDIKAILGGTRGGAMSAWKGCEVYGFESLISPYAPQGLVVSATIFWYYLLDLWVHRDGLDSIATLLAFMLFFGLQVWQLQTCENFSESIAVKSAIALAEGLFIGGTGFGIVQSTIPDRLPSSVLPKVPRLSSMTKNPDGTYTDSSGKVYVVGPDGITIPKSTLSFSCPQNQSGLFDALGNSIPASLSTCPK